MSDLDIRWQQRLILADYFPRFKALERKMTELSDAS